MILDGRGKYKRMQKYIHWGKHDKSLVFTLFSGVEFILKQTHIPSSHLVHFFHEDLVL